jgi:hypothetical protein
MHRLPGFHHGTLFVAPPFWQAGLRGAVAGAGYGNAAALGEEHVRRTRFGLRIAAAEAGLESTVHLSVIVMLAGHPQRIDKSLRKFYPFGYHGRAVAYSLLMVHQRHWLLAG